MKLEIGVQWDKFKLNKYCWYPKETYFSKKPRSYGCQIGSWGLVCNHRHRQGQPGQQGLAGGRAVVGDGMRLAAVGDGKQGRPVSRSLG